MKIKSTITAIAASLALAVFGAAYADGGGHGAKSAYEVWGFDQSHAHLDGDTHSGPDRDGILYIWSGTDKQFKKGHAATESYNWEDLLEGFYGVGNVPAGFGTPHMTLWNTGATHLVVGHTSGNSGVTIVDGDSRTVVDSTTVGGNAHAAIPAPDNSFILVANISNQIVHKLDTNYAGGFGNIFTGATALDLAAAGVPAAIGAGSAKPICPVITASGDYAYVTLAAGGLVIIDNNTMTVAHTYTVDETLDLVDANGNSELDAGDIGQNGCGGIEKDGIVYINSGTKNPENGEMVYAFNNAYLESTGNKPDFIRIPQNGNDTHGMAVIGNYLWACNRGSNTCSVHDIEDAADLFQGANGTYDPSLLDPGVASDPIRIVNVVDLQGPKLGDPAPDLVDVSPSGKVFFIAQRGPKAFTANSDAFHNAEGDGPGLGVLWRSRKTARTASRKPTTA